MIFFVKYFYFRSLWECDNYDVGPGPFSMTLYHDGTDGITMEWVKVNIFDLKMLELSDEFET